ncbi:hypothetical protein F5X96DRAFT_633616 [Biscogniauxia mediterranea]|nr:hypothetical protein F5X96DRAFT_633616 [Biscogniauxia mediterranea]
MTFALLGELSVLVLSEDLIRTILFQWKIRSRLRMIEPLRRSGASRDMTESFTPRRDTVTNKCKVLKSSDS